MCTCCSHRARLLFGLPHCGSPYSCMAGDLPMRRRDWLTAVGSLTALLWAAPSLVAARLSGKSTRFDYVASGVVRGSQITKRMPDGSLDIQFEFTDRGRGPKVHSVIALDSQGMISNLRTTGHNYFKAPVDEKFVVRNGQAIWKNVGEHDKQPSAPARFYISMDGTPEEGAILARAALRAPKGTLPVWPAGEATIEKIQTLSVSNGGVTRTVTMYDISGLDFSPSQSWLDEDGALFMSGGEWGAIISTGWKSVLPKLFAAQNEHVTALGRQFATTVPQHVGTAIAITSVALFDSEKGNVQPNATVLIKGDTIVAVGTSDTAIPSDARRIDGAGKTLVPGLWNMHMHLYDVTIGPLLLAEGATTIRDPGNAPEYISRAQKQFESGELIGPRVIIAGLMDGPGKYTAPIGTTTDNAVQAVSQVRVWKKLGAVQIKMYSSLDPKLVPIIAKEAHSLGMRVSGHIPAGMLAQDAVRQGFDEIQHVNFLFLNFMPDTMNKTQTPLRLTAAMERAATIDLQSQAVKEFIALLKERDIVCDPTLVIFNVECMRRDGDILSTGFGEIAGWIPPQVRRGYLLVGGMPMGPGMDAKYRASAKAFNNMVSLLHQSGIRIVAGTDDVLPGFDLIRELELYSQAGIPNTDVLQIATIQSARVMHMDDKLGSLKVGKLADAIIVHGNPLDDISQLRNVGTTIKGGVIYDTRALYATAGVRAPALS